MTGVEAIRERVHRYQDVKRYQAYEARAEEVSDRQRREKADLTRRHEMQALDRARTLRNLDKLDARERRSLQAGLERQRREAARQYMPHVPSVTLELKPPGRPARVVKAMTRHRHGPARPVTDQDEKHAVQARLDHEGAFDAAAQGRREERRHARESTDPAVDLTDDFDRAAHGVPKRRRAGEDRSAPDIHQDFSAAAEGRSREASGGNSDGPAPTRDEAPRPRDADRPRADRSDRPSGRDR